ncbi:MAG: hypothetical protein IJS00_07210 [Paludibacteraceae bacterium]|nr:hypothetical protein [Paludibacteraceae bacterium]
MLKESVVRALALEVGFDDCRIARARRLDDAATFMDAWVDAGLAGEMTYLERNRNLRYDIRELVPGAQTVVVCLLTYEHSGKDYHRSVKSLLYNMQSRLQEALPEEVDKEKWVSEGQHIFCDSAPVLERRWAVEAGLGWIGKNHQLITTAFGSKVHIGELVVNIPIERDLPPLPTSDCGLCSKCIEACPGSALGQDIWDARRCIAYVTHKCLVCQEVCPYNTR